MVSSRYGMDSDGVGDDGADDSLTPESVPDGPVASRRADRFPPSEISKTEEKISDHLPFGIVHFDAEQNIVYCNPQQAHLLGIDIRDGDGIEDWLERGCRDPDYARQIVDSWRDHVWRKQLTRVFSLKTADEKLREIEFRSKLLEDGGLLLTLFDVTETRRSEDALRLTETKFNTVFEHVTIGVALADRTGRFFEVNPALESLLDFPRWELRRMALNELVPPEEYELLRRTERELGAGIGGDERTLAIHFRRKDGTSLPAEVTLSPIRNGGRQPNFTAYFIRDSHGEKEVREDLRESREQNRALLEAIPDLILLLDGKGTIEDLVPPAGAWRGRKVAPEWAGNLLSDVWPELGQESSEALQQSFRSGTVEEFTFWDEPGTGGEDVCISGRVAPCGIDQVVALVADETDRANAREALSRQGVAFRHMKEAVILTDLQGRVLDCNPAGTRIFGYGKDELQGMGLADLYAAPEDRDSFNYQISQSLTEHGEWRGTSEFFRKDGQRGFGEVVFVPVTGEAGPLSLLGIHREVTRDTLDNIAAERVQHRIRNQLQMVGSLFGLESKEREGEQAILDKLQARLRAVTRLQEARVAGSEPGTVRLLTYAQALADDLKRISTGLETVGDPIAVFGDESVESTVDIAAPFGLLVVELGTAVFESASPSGAAPLLDGELTLILQPAESGTFRLIADVSSGVMGKVSMPTIQCLVSQLRGRVEQTPLGRHTRLTVALSGAD